MVAAANRHKLLERLDPDQKRALIFSAADGEIARESSWD
jgi:hypothetical protein